MPCNQTFMECVKNKRASRHSESTRTMSEVNEVIIYELFDLSELHVLHSRLQMVKAELYVLNIELKNFMMDEQVAEDQIPYWNMKTLLMAHGPCWSII